VRWLVTVRVGADLDALRRELAAAGGAVEDDEPVPLSGDELAVPASGPPDLPQRLRDSATAVAVYPDSDMELY
jgi:hypothetical protein